MTADTDERDEQLGVTNDVANVTVAAIAAAAVPNFAAVAGLSVGAVSLGRRLYSIGAQKRADKRGVEYLAMLAEHLSDAEMAQLAASLDEAGESETWSFIEKSFRTITDAIDETAKKCLAVMVADYYRSLRMPDRDYQLTGRLISECDTNRLHALVPALRQFSKVYDLPHGDGTESNVTYTLMHRVAESGESIMFCARGYIRSTDKRRGLNYHLTEGRVDQVSPGEPPPEHLLNVVHLLSRYEFGSAPNITTGNSTEVVTHGVAKGDVVMFVSRDALSRFRRLYDYLQPVFFEMEHDPHGGPASTPDARGES